MTRQIVLPELPYKKGSQKRAELEAYARAAVEADRKEIVVTDEDVESIIVELQATDIRRTHIRAALESFATRLQGETP